jgi:hypothetical protein
LIQTWAAPSTRRMLGSAINVWWENLREGHSHRLIDDAVTTIRLWLLPFWRDVDTRI